jgi:ketosteroid isomerase-like protein
MTPKLTTSHVRNLFNPLTEGDPAAFFANVIDDIEWIVTGTAQVAGRWTNKEEYLKDGWYRIGNIMQRPMRLSIENIIVADYSEEQGLAGTAVVELKGVGGLLRNGVFRRLYSLLFLLRWTNNGLGKEYNNEYCWIVGFDTDGKIRRVKAYLDTAKLRDSIEENERK